MINRKASVLIISLWILISLSLLAVGLGFQASLDLRIAKNESDRLKAYLFSRSGVLRAVALIDSKFQDCAEKTKKEIFSREFDGGKGNFKIGYFDESGNFIYGIKPQDGLININYVNGLSDFQKIVIKNLFLEKNIADAQDLSNVLVDWVNPLSQSLSAKKDNIIVPEELIIILENFYNEKGFSQEDAARESRIAYNKVRDIIRVAGDGKIDINSATLEVLKIFVISAAENSGYDLAAANSLYTKLNTLFHSQVFKDDGNIVISDATPDEAGILDYLKSNIFKVNSDIFKIESWAEFNQAKRKVVAVYNQKNKKLVYWQEN